MRKLNAIVTVLIFPVFLIHMIWGGLILTGMTSGGSSMLRGVTHLLLTLIVVHMVIGIKLTVDTVIASRRSGVSYFRLNRLFWIRRISGFALMFFITSHAMLLSGRVSGNQYRLNLFDGMQFALQILMVITLLVHLLTNITPLRIALGLEDRKNFRTDLMLVLSILLFLAGAAFTVYFLRWYII